MIENLHRYFDHALLYPEVTESDITRLCKEAIEYDLFSIAINPCWVKHAKSVLSGTNVKILSAVGFPLSANTTEIKSAEAAWSVEDGADEIDMVANVGWLAMGEYGKVEKEIALVRKAIGENILLKVIIECPRISAEVQVGAVSAVINGGTQFVKTCTGFFGGATVEMVERLFKAASGQIKVKASGGIKTLADTTALINAGAERIGSSSSVAIMNEYLQKVKTE